MEAFRPYAENGLDRQARVRTMIYPRLAVAILAATIVPAGPGCASRTPPGASGQTPTATRPAVAAATAAGAGAIPATLPTTLPSAVEVLREARSAAESAHGLSLAWALTRIAEAQIDAGDWGGAADSVSGIPTDHEKRDASEHIGRVLAMSGHLIEARQLMLRSAAISDEQEEMLACEAAVAGARAGRIEESLKVVEKLPRPYDRAKLLMRFAGAAGANIAQGDRRFLAKAMDDCRAEAARVAGPGEESTTLMLARAWHNIGDDAAATTLLKAAINLCDRIGDEYCRRESLAEIAVALAGSGDYESAVRQLDRARDGALLV